MVADPPHAVKTDEAQRRREGGKRARGGPTGFELPRVAGIGGTAEHHRREAGPPRGGAGCRPSPRGPPHPGRPPGGGCFPITPPPRRGGERGGDGVALWSSPA